MFRHLAFAAALAASTPCLASDGSSPFQVDFALTDVAMPDAASAYEATLTTDGRDLRKLLARAGYDPSRVVTTRTTELRADAPVTSSVATNERHYPLLVTVVDEKGHERPLSDLTDGQRYERLSLRAARAGDALDVTYAEDVSRLACGDQMHEDGFDTYSTKGTTVNLPTCDGLVTSRVTGVLHLRPGEPALVVLPDANSIDRRGLHLIRLSWDGH